MSLFMPGQTNLLAICSVVIFRPGWERECICCIILSRKGAGINGRCNPSRSLHHRYLFDPGMLIFCSRREIVSDVSAKIFFSSSSEAWAAKMSSLDTYGSSFIASILDNMSATILFFPGICLISVENCPISSRCLSCLGEAFSGVCLNAKTSGL